METTNTVRPKKRLGMCIAIVVVIIIIVIVINRSNRDDQDATSTTNSNTAAVTIPPVDTTRKTVYKDGTYTAVGSYMSPGGPDKIGVTITLASGAVTDISLDLQPGDDTSKRFQDIFAANYKQYVIGKDISTLNLTKVSSSSLTSKGFNDAVAQIKLRAKA